MGQDKEESSWREGHAIIPLYTDELVMKKEAILRKLEAKRYLLAAKKQRENEDNPS